MEGEPWLNLFLLAILCPLITGAPSFIPCPDENLSIIGGRFAFSEDGSAVRYSCSEGYYPTVRIRLCVRGRWNPLPKKKLPECQKITCPDPRGFENGEVYPFQRQYFVNDTTNYSCNSGYDFRGSGTRVCKVNGKWSGGTPVCGRNSDLCPDPGIPAGCTREGHRFNIDDKVTYRCENKFTLVGSKERVCQENGQWSGTEPQCYADFTYDSPEEASEGFSSSLKSSLAVSQQHEGKDQYGKQIHVNIGGKLDIYIALDASASITKDDLLKAKTVIKTLIEKISYYEVSPNYEILIFATDVTRIVSMRDFKSEQRNNLLEILQRLEDYNSKGERTGTNIALAYKSILESMKIEQLRNKEDFKKTQHIVIMFTDGQANMGGNPRPWVDEIKELVKQNSPSEEENLELYVFGMGDSVNAESINDLKTDRGNEKFFFKLRDLTELQKTFDEMIDEGSSVALCGLYRDYDDETDSHKRYKYPWLAKITVARSNGKMSNCIGSLVTSSFILTAAHCFRFDDTPDRITLDFGSDNKGIKVKNYILHPRYDVAAKKKMGIPEYYEFDVALIQLEDPVIMGVGLRTICIPCTKETSGALKLSDREVTCRKHQEELMSGETVKASFMSVVDNDIENKLITIKQGKWRDACVEDAKKAKGINATNAKDIVTDNFLCSGGTEPTVDDVACKGDSGGATYVVPGNRLVQVGIVSWGVEDLCKDTRKPKPRSYTRDYHTNLFSAEVREFLKRYLGDEKLGTPLTFL
ncbi:complement factor B-like [Carassius auratus]|uniref:C3/C5 convertase n=1 Tax=Carassius auratus TaxID=7957 RepID=A0A6P6MXN1_CARAU|nr:complement factor B-like [Carassius auratus]